MDGMNRMKRHGFRAGWLLVVALAAAGPVLGQAPTGPLPPKPGVAVQPRNGTITIPAEARRALRLGPAVIGARRVYGRGRRRAGLPGRPGLSR